MNDVIVLAAGLGRRLAAATTLPKWLAPVGASSPAEVQLAGFCDAGVERLVVVTSPSALDIARAVEPWRDRLAVSLVSNPHAATRNNWYSLVLGFEGWLAIGGDAVTVVNSDLFARPSWMARMLADMAGAEVAAALAIDDVRPLTDEAMKVSATGRWITAIGKRGVVDPRGEYVGVSRWHRAAAMDLLAILTSFVDVPERVDNWYEHGIQEHLLAGAEYLLVPVPDCEWIEIDDERDLDAARALQL